jgi:hypothetical protein
MGVFVAVDDVELNAVWNESVASDLSGKLILIGLTFMGPDGQPERLEQFFGRVTKAQIGVAITLLLEGSRRGESFSLPPDTRSFRRAAPGEYRLRATGEVVSNPDYTVTFTVQRDGKDHVA